MCQTCPKHLTTSGALAEIKQRWTWRLSLHRHHEALASQEVELDICVVVIISHCMFYYGVVYTMDHEVVPWPLNSSWDHFGLHQRKHVKVTMEIDVPKTQILRPTLSIDMV
jgi:hypothetical protein